MQSISILSNSKGKPADPTKEKEKCNKNNGSSAQKEIEFRKNGRIQSYGWSDLSIKYMNRKIKNKIMLEKKKKVSTLSLSSVYLFYIFLPSNVATRGHSIVSFVASTIFLLPALKLIDDYIHIYTSQLQARVGRFGGNPLITRMKRFNVNHLSNIAQNLSSLTETDTFCFCRVNVVFKTRIVD